MFFYPLAMFFHDSGTVLEFLGNQKDFRSELVEYEW
jgi:hypothetical protein